MSIPGPTVTRVSRVLTGQSGAVEGDDVGNGSDRVRREARSLQERLKSLRCVGMKWECLAESSRARVWPSNTCKTDSIRRPELCLLFSGQPRGPALASNELQ